MIDWELEIQKALTAFRDEGREFVTGSDVIRRIMPGSDPKEFAWLFSNGSVFDSLWRKQIIDKVLVRRMTDPQTTIESVYWRMSDTEM